MVKVVQRGRFGVYVYVERGQRHHKAHCHVLWPDGAAVVGLRTLERLAGDELPATAEGLVRDSIDEIIAMWNRLNPERPVR